MADSRKSKSILKLERKMSEVQGDPLRLEVLKSTVKFKSSWIELGRFLYQIKRNKNFRDWNYTSFENYCEGELGLRKQTAAKLLYSYYFLENEEPQFLSRLAEGESAQQIPSFETVHLLRLAKQSDRLAQKDYEEVRHRAFEQGAEPRAVRRYILDNRITGGSKKPDQDDPKKSSLWRIHRLLGQVQGELSHYPRVPRGLLAEIESLAERIKEFLS